MLQQGEGCIWEMHPRGGVYPEGGVYPGGASMGTSREVNPGGLDLGCTLPQIVDRMTDACENITFAALLRNAVGKHLSIQNN